jgi:hypothetical protein
MNVDWKPPRTPIYVSAVFAAIAVLSIRAEKSQAIPQSSAVERGTAQRSGPGKVELYAGVGDGLVQYDVDVERATLLKRGSVTLPGNVGEGDVHPSRRYIYVPWSNSNGVAGNRYGVSAFRIDPASGALTLDGQPATLPASASNVT